jgi:hypothetical protein
MALDPSLAPGQIQTGYTAISNFYNAMAAAVAAGSAPPSFASVASTLAFDQLVSLAQGNAHSNASAPGAAAVETAHGMAAAQREWGLRTLGKSAIYTNGQIDANNEGDFYSAMMTLYTNMIQGIFSPGATA